MFHINLSIFLCQPMDFGYQYSQSGHPARHKREVYNINSLVLQYREVYHKLQC
eukprot:m.78042 g.78042  ORF g.78042 m.78042 type:complete len:53 (-) comp12654_c0_seq2:557-715(-)